MEECAILRLFLTRLPTVTNKEPIRRLRGIHWELRRFPVVSYGETTGFPNGTIW